MLIGFVLAIVLARPGLAAAQSSFDSEVSAPHELALSVDFLGSIDRRAAGGFEWYLPDLTAGLGHGVEAGLAWSATVANGPTAEREWLPHAKWRLFDANHVALAVGNAWHIPARSAGDRAYGLLQASASTELTWRRTATLSAGVYRLVAGVPAGATRRGMTLGASQELSRRWSLDLEWVSGRNYYGYFSSQASVSLGDSSVSGGYCVGNERHANHGPCASFTRTF